ncbi:MAG: hypothetical protein ACXWZP_06390 [Gaiellaceae bacterium]
MRDGRNPEARHQTRTRAFNEWIEEANESMGLHVGTDPFRCECGDGACVHPISLTRVEYESVRAYPTRFAIATNHENPEADQVVAEHERYTIVEKLVGLASRQAHRSNPR